MKTKLFFESLWNSKMCWKQKRNVYETFSKNDDTNEISCIITKIYSE